MILLFLLLFPGLVSAAQQARLPEPVAKLALTPGGTLAIRGPAPIACGADGTIFVVDRAGFKVLRFDPSGKALPQMPFMKRSPAMQPNLVSSIAVSDAVYLASTEAGFVLRVGLEGPAHAMSWLGLATGGLPFLQIPTRLAPGEKPQTIAVWDPGLKMVVTLGAQGEILDSDRKVGLTPWPAPGGGHLLVADSADGTWRLKESHGPLDLPLPARAGAEKTSSCEVVGAAPGGGWIVHHYLGEDPRSSGACLRRVTPLGKIARESVFALSPAEDLPPPPGSAVAPDGRVWFLSGTQENASLMVVSP